MREQHVAALRSQKQPNNPSNLGANAAKGHVDQTTAMTNSPGLAGLSQEMEEEHTPCQR